MNILTFDIEEWYIEKVHEGDRANRYYKFDKHLQAILDLLEETNIKATFFCVGKLATMFPEVVMKISNKGHEIGCHSDVHTWLTLFNRKKLFEDTYAAISSLENLTGKKIISYRAPAFSIGENNKWAFEILAENKIERDASVYPSNRDFGGFPDFPVDSPVIIKCGDYTLKEFPICMTHFMGRSMAYSGGGYFRLFPYWYIKREFDRNDYTISYFHINDLMPNEDGMMSKEVFEKEYGISGNLLNRYLRYIKESLGTKTAFDKMCRFVRECDFISLEDADKCIDWSNVPKVRL